MTEDVPALDPLVLYVVVPVDRMATLSLQRTNNPTFENDGMKGGGAYV